MRCPNRNSVTCSRRSLEEALEGEAAGDARLQSWLRGDINALAKETREGMLADPQLREALLVSRNKAWAKRIAAEMASKEDDLRRRGRRAYGRAGRTGGFARTAGLRGRAHPVSARLHFRALSHRGAPFPVMVIPGGVAGL